MLIDTHVHYNLEPLFSNEVEPHHWKTHWKKAQDEGVKKSIIVGTDFFSSSLATQLAGKSERLFASVGCHPNFYHETYIEAKTQGRVIPTSLFEDIETDIFELGLIMEGKKVVAIGETGLDYYRLPKDGAERDVTIAVQKEAFIQQIKLSLQSKKPLICHIRDKETPDSKTKGIAYWDAIEILQKNNVKNFVLHCVSGPKKYVQQAIEMGGYMGFDGNITYPKAESIRELFAIVPENRRLLETDAPYLPPQQFRGKICEPWMIVKTVEYIEEKLEVDRNTFYENAERLFKLL